jgi:hypothetical protein
MFGLSEPLGVEAGAPPDTVEKALEGKIVGQTTFTGRYGTRGE